MYGFGVSAVCCKLVFGVFDCVREVVLVNVVVCEYECMSEGGVV